MPGLGENEGMSLTPTLDTVPAGYVVVETATGLPVLKKAA